MSEKIFAALWLVIALANLLFVSPTPAEFWYTLIIANIWIAASYK